MRPREHEAARQAHVRMRQEAERLEAEREKTEKYWLEAEKNVKGERAQSRLPKISKETRSTPTMYRGRAVRSTDGAERDHRANT